MDFVNGTREAIIGFTGKSGGDDAFNAAATGGVRQETWISTVAGDDPESVWNWHDGKTTASRRNDKTQSPNTFPKSQNPKPKSQVTFK